MKHDRLPYTRDTIALIRKGAKHDALGWDESFYTRVCREHGISFHQPKESNPNDPCSSRPVANPDCEYNVATHELVRGGEAVILTNTTGRLFCVLARGPYTGFIGGVRVADQMGIQIDSVSSRTTALRKLIGPLGIRIMSERHSGYRLADESGEPLRVSIAGRGK